MTHHVPSDHHYSNILSERNQALDKVRALNASLGTSHVAIRSLRSDLDSANAELVGHRIHAADNVKARGRYEEVVKDLKEQLAITKNDLSSFFFAEAKAEDWKDLLKTSKEHLIAKDERIKSLEEQLAAADARCANSALIKLHNKAEEDRININNLEYNLKNSNSVSACLRDALEKSLAANKTVPTPLDELLGTVSNALVRYNNH